MNNYGKHRNGPIIYPVKNQIPVRFLRRAVCAATLFPMAFLAGCSLSEEEEAHAPGLDHFSTEATPPGTIRFSSETEESQVFLGVYDAGGRLLRTILSGVSYPEGNHEVEWDGRDRLGEPLPEGEYQWRMLATPGFTARYIGSLGVNPTHGAPYDYTWGNLGPPTGIAAEDGFMVVSAPAENVPATFVYILTIKAPMMTPKQRFLTAMRAYVHRIWLDCLRTAAILGAEKFTTGRDARWY